MSDKYPDDLRYTKDHEWARIDGNRAVVGITSFAAAQLGDVVMVELPNLRDKVQSGDTLGTIESVKAVSEVYVPLSGVIIKVNDPVKDSPETVNEDCYDEGWLVEIELSNPDEAKELMTSKEYEQYTKDQG